MLGENANARVPQSDLTAEQKAEAQRHLDRHKRALGIGEFAETQREPFKHPWKEQEEIEFTVAPEPTLDEVIESCEEAFETVNSIIDGLVSRIEALEKGQKAAEKPEDIQEAKKLKETLQAEIKLLEQQKAGLQKQVEELNRKKSLAEAVVQPGPSEPTIPLKEVITMIEGVLPSIMVERSWSFGAQRFCQGVRGVIHKLRGKLEQQERT